jgi:hypothetical protein
METVLEFICRCSFPMTLFRNFVSLVVMYDRFFVYNRAILKCLLHAMMTINMEHKMSIVSGV